MLLSQLDGIVLNCGPPLLLGLVGVLAGVELTADAPAVVNPEQRPARPGLPSIDCERVRVDYLGPDLGGVAAARAVDVQPRVLALGREVLDLATDEVSTARTIGIMDQCEVTALDRLTLFV